MYLFSPSTLGFYPIEMKEEYLTNGSLPSDVIEVSDSVRNEYNFAPPEGKQLSSSKNMPVWIDIPPATHEQLIQAAENERKRVLAAADAVMLDWRTELMLGEISDANRTKLSAWLAYKNQVKTWDIKTDPENVSWPVLPEV